MRVGMPTTEDERMVWLAGAYAVIRSWENTHEGNLLTVTEQARLAAKIATALQTAYDQGRAQTEGPSGAGS